MTSLSLLTIPAALVAVLALILLAARVVRAGGFAPRAGAPRRIKVLETTALDQRRRLHLVRCEGRSLLLLTGGAQDALLGWLPELPPDSRPGDRETP